MYFLLFISIWILLPLVPSSLLCILIFLLCFLFGLVLSALHLKTSFSLIGSRGASLSFALPSTVSSLITLLPLLYLLTLPILDFSPPFLLSLMLLLVLSPHPSCQADWGTPLGRCWQTAAGLFAGLYQVGTPTKESFGSLATLLTGVIPNLHFRVAYTLPLSKLRKMKVRHNLGTMCQYLMSYICLPVFGDCAEIRRHNNNSKVVRLSSAALARDLVLPALLSLRKRTF